MPYIKGVWVEPPPKQDITRLKEIVPKPKSDTDILNMQETMALMQDKRTTRKNENGLTPMQQVFADEFMRTGKVKASAEAAGANPSCASVRGTNLLGNPFVQAYINRKNEERSDRTLVTAEKVVAEAACVAFSDITEVMDWDGKTLTIEQFRHLPRHITVAIKKFVYRDMGEKGITVSIEMHNKMDGINMLAKHLGLFAKHNETLPPGGENQSLTINVVNVTQAIERKLSGIIAQGTTGSILPEPDARRAPLLEQRLEVLGAGQPVTSGQSRMVHLEQQVSDPRP